MKFKTCNLQVIDSILERVGLPVFFNSFNIHGEGV